MRRFIALLLITGIAWAQTNYDKLVLKNGKEYLGEYVKTEKDKVYFNSHEENVFPLVRHKRKVQTLQLKDGTFVINNPPRSEWTIKEKAVYDAKRDSKKYLAYTTLALLSSGGLGAVTFLILEAPFRSLDVGEELSFIGATIVGSLGLVGSYNHFSKLDKKNIEGISADDIELYQQAYSKEIKDRKLKNIVISTGLIGIVCALGALIVAGGVSSAISDGEPFPLP
tara:strand:+ start:466 stop:1140 length:675 start_codon:yes stop_codon:yes gene_type:complete